MSTFAQRLIQSASYDQRMLKQFIASFLQINPQPSDDQVHCLAASLALDPETLEAVVYQMLGAHVRGRGVLALTEDEEVLDGERDPEFGPDKHALLIDDGFDPDQVNEDQDLLRP